MANTTAVRKATITNRNKGKVREIINPPIKDISKKIVKAGIHPNRVKEMLETGSLIREEYNNFKKYYNVKYVDADSIVEVKLNSKKNMPLRAYFAKKIHDYLNYDSRVVLSSEDIQFYHKQLPFIIEMVICIQYYHNQILDGKAGVTHQDAISKNLLIANLLKEQLYKYITDRLGTRSNLVKEYVIQMFEFVDYGQLVEQHFNRYQNFKENKFPKSFLDEKFLIPQDIEDKLLKTLKYPKEKKTFLKWYLQRIYMTSAGLFLLTTKLILQLCKKENKSLTRFATLYGINLQLVNDNCDFVPSKHNQTTKDKIATDAFSDLRNSNVTLPTFIRLTSGKNESIIYFLEQKPKRMTTRWEDKLFKDIVDSGAMATSMALTKLFAKAAYNCLPNDNPHTWAFKDMTQIARFNRYYYYFKNPVEEFSFFQKFNIAIGALGEFVKHIFIAIEFGLTKQPVPMV